MSERDPRFRLGWTTEPAVEAIWRPLVDADHPFNRPEVEADRSARGAIPYHWDGMTPGQLAAILDLAPWERRHRVNVSPPAQWFLDPLAEHFPDVTFHGLIHTKVAQFAVEGFQLIAVADRILDLLAWLRTQRVPYPWPDGVQYRQGDTILVSPDDWDLHREDEGPGGRWHLWWWWD
jgi:hypothetical protein